MGSNSIVPDLVSGVLNAQWLILEMLDRRGILPREDVIAELEAALRHLQESPPAPPAQTMPLRHLIRALSGPGSGGPKGGTWTPIVIPGGLAEEEDS